MIIFVIRAPIVWYSKRQNTVEASTFGSEFIAMKVAVELIQALRYKLRMFGIPVDGATSVLGDNQSVVVNVIAPESTLKKKHLSIAYHRCREASASRMVIVGYVPSKENVADLATKVLPPITRQKSSGDDARVFSH